MPDPWQLAVVALALLVFIQTIAIWALARAIGVVQIQLGPLPGPLLSDEGLPLNSPAPGFSGQLAATNVRYEWASSMRRTLLLFLTPTCSACREALRAATNLAVGRKSHIEVVAISDGRLEQNQVLAGAARAVPLVHDEGGAIHKQYRISQTPTAVLVTNGLIEMKGIVNSLQHLEAMLDGEGRPVPKGGWKSVRAPRTPPEVSRTDASDAVEVHRHGS